MERAFVRLESTDPERLRELLGLELQCAAQRTRRRLAVNLLALTAGPLALAALEPALAGAWRTFMAESWLAIAAAAVGLWVAELRCARRLERALRRR